MMCRITFLYLDFNAIGAQTRIVLSETPSFITIALILRIYGWLQSGFPNTMASRQQVHWCVPNYLETLTARTSMGFYLLPIPRMCVAVMYLHLDFWVEFIGGHWLLWNEWCVMSI